MSTIQDVESVAGTGIRLGTTLYSFTNEWVAARYTLESLVETVAETGIGPGVEIVGFQSIRSFPNVEPEFVRWWRDLLDRTGLVASCLGSNIDVGLRRDRFLNTEEMVDYLSRQIVSARELGFPVLRIQMGATDEVIEQVTPLAERSNVVLGMEIHAPESGGSAEMRRVAAVYDLIGSANLGFIPDFSSTMRGIPSGQLALYRERGLDDDLIELLRQRWAEPGAPIDRYTRWADEARAAGAPENAVRGAQLTFTMFGTECVESWAPIADRIVHVHGKFYEIDDSGAEPNIDYPAMMRMLVEAGYQGFISTEWEGHGFTELDGPSTAQLIARQQRLEAAAIEQVARG